MTEENPVSLQIISTLLLNPQRWFTCRELLDHIGYPMTGSGIFSEVKNFLKNYEKTFEVDTAARIHKIRCISEVQDSNLRACANGLNRNFIEHVARKRRAEPTRTSKATSRRSPGYGESIAVEGDALVIRIPLMSIMKELIQKGD